VVVQAVEVKMLQTIVKTEETVMVAQVWPATF
jgi:hypothetical protein